MSEEKYITIGTINLQSSTIGEDINSRFGSIDKNFKQIIEAEYLKGASGRDINIMRCEFTYDKSVDEKIYNLYIGNEQLTNKRIGEFIYNTIKGSKTDTSLKSITINKNKQEEETVDINWYDDLLTTNNIYLVYEYDAIANKNKVISSLPFIHIDNRFTGSVLSMHKDHNLIDTSCSVIFSDNVFCEVQSAPTLYFNDNLDEFCWKINGQETDLIARGPKGENFDTNTKLSCVKLGEAKGESYYKIDYILTDHYNPNSKDEENTYVCGFTSIEDAKIEPNPLGIPIYGIHTTSGENPKTMYFFNCMYFIDNEWVTPISGMQYLEGGLLKAGLYGSLYNNYPESLDDLIGAQKVGMLFLPQNSDVTKAHVIYGGSLTDKDAFEANRATLNISPLELGSNEAKVIEGQSLNIDYNVNIMGTATIGTAKANIIDINTANMNIAKADSMQVKNLTVSDDGEFNIKDITTQTVKANELRGNDKIFGALLIGSNIEVDRTLKVVSNTEGMNATAIIDRLIANASLDSYGNANIHLNTKTVLNHNKTEVDDFDSEFKIDFTQIDPQDIPTGPITPTPMPIDDQQTITKTIFSINKYGIKNGYLVPEFKFDGVVNTDNFELSGKLDAKCSVGTSAGSDIYDNIMNINNEYLPLLWTEDTTDDSDLTPIYIMGSGNTQSVVGGVKTSKKMYSIINYATSNSSNSASTITIEKANITELLRILKLALPQLIDNYVDENTKALIGDSTSWIETYKTYKISGI